MINQYLNNLYTHSLCPKSFPGKYPTRINYTLFDNKGNKAFQYRGKPTAQAIEKFVEHLAKQTPVDVYSFVYGEYDQNGLVFGLAALIANPVTFYPKYYVVSTPHFRHLGYGGVLASLKDRELFTLEGKTIYVSRCLMGSRFRSEYIRKVRECLRGIITTPFFSQAMSDFHYQYLCEEGNKILVPMAPPAALPTAPDVGGRFLVGRPPRAIRARPVLTPVHVN